jgi:hypothetical protein
VADDVALPPQYPTLVAGALRNAQYAAAPATPNFDANIAEAKAHAAHQDSLRMWRVLAARGHEGALAVVAHHGLAPQLPVTPPVFTPAPVRAVAPKVPRVVAPAATPAAPQTPTMTNLQRRIDLLTNLMSPPVPPDLI